MINLTKKCSLALAGILLLFNFTVSNAIADHHKSDKRYGWLSCEKLQEKLNLDENQQNAWTDASNEMKALREKYMPMFKEEKAKIKEKIKTEADKDEPDLAVLFSAFKDMKKDYSKFSDKAHKIQLGIYNELNAEQKKIVFDKVAKKKMKKMKKAHEMMKKSDDDDSDDNGENGDKKKKKGWW